MIIKLFGRKKQMKKEQQEFETKTEAMLENWGIDEEDMLEPPPPLPTMEQLAAVGLAGETAKAYLYIQRYMADGIFNEDLGAGFEFNSDEKDAVFQRMVLLPEFFQAVSDVLFAITTKKIKPRFEDVKKGMPLLTRRLFHKDTWKFWTAVNELKNISTGMSTFA